MPKLEVRIGAQTRELDRALVQSADLFEKFDKVVTDTGGTLKRVTQGFTGEKVIVQAHAMTKAFQDLAANGIGLTDRELRKLNATVAEAASKYQRMGREVPAEFQRVLDSTAHVNKQAGLLGSAFGSLKTIASGVFAGFTIDRALSSITRMVGETMAFSGKLTDLSAKTGISTEALQKWNYAATQNGNTIEQITGAVGQLQNRLGSGDSSALAALSRLGVSFEAIRQMSPEQQFETIASALMRVTDQNEKAALAMDLFGRAGLEVLPTIEADLAAVADEAERLGLVLSGKTIAAMDAFGDSLDRAGMLGKAFVTNILSPWIEGLNALGQAYLQANEEQKGFFGTLLQATSIPSLRDYLDAIAQERPKVAGKVPALRINKPLTALPFYKAEEALAQYKKDDKATAKAEEAARLAQLRAWAGKQIIPIHTQPILTNQFSLADLQTFAQGQTARMTPIGLSTEMPLSYTLGALPTWAGAGALGPGPKTPSFLSRAFGGASQFGGSLATTVLSAFTGGGNVGQALGGQLGGQLLGGLAQSITTNAATGLAKTAFSSGIGKLFGGALNAVLPGIGSLLGGLAGKLFGKLFGGEGKQTKQMRDQWLQQAGGLAEVRKMAEYAGVSIDKLLSTKKTKTFEAEVKKLEAAFKATQERVQKLTTELGDLARTGGLATKDLIGRLTRDLDKSEVQAAFGDFVKTNLSAAAEGLSTFLASATTLPLTARSAEALGGALAGVFAQARALGTSLPAILQQLGPAVQTLSDRLSAAGLDGGAAFGELRELAALAASEVAGPLLSGVDGLTAAMVGLANTGLLTEDMFGGLTEQVGAAYAKIVEGGASGDAAIRAMGPSLQKVWELQQQYGFAVDATTQGLIDQALAQGVVGEQMKSTQDQILGVLKAIAKVLGADIPEAAGQAASAIERELGQIRIPAIKVPIEIQGEPAGEAHSGALILAGNLRRFHRGGLASDEVMAVLQTGEAVLSRAAVRRLGTSTVQRINRGEVAGGGPGGATTITVPVMLDGYEIAHVVARHVPQVLKARGVA